MSVRDVVIVAAGRTPIGNFLGAFNTVSAVDLGATVIKGLVDKAAIDPSEVDEVIFGQVLNAGDGQNPIRQASIKAGLPHSTPAMGISKVCGSGLKAIHLASQAIMLGDAEVIIAGGQENMSQSGHVLPNSRGGAKMGDWSLVDTMIQDGLTDAFADYHMGITAENIVEKYGITREEQDEFVLESIKRSRLAIKKNIFEEEIAPIEVKSRQGVMMIGEDELPARAKPDRIQYLKPAFRDGHSCLGAVHK